MPRARYVKDQKRDLYFIQGVSGGPIKIGVSYDVEARLAQFQMTSPVRLHVLGIVPRVLHGRESTVHQQFAAARLHGEWFSPTPELLAYIDEHTKAARPAAAPFHRWHHFGHGYFDLPKEAPTAAASA